MLTDKGQISVSQLALLLFPSILATSILSVPSITKHYAGHDMWLSPIWGSFVGLAVIGISIGLSRLFPGKTIIQASPLIIGRFGGKLIGLAYLFYLPHLTGVIVRQYGEFIGNNALPETPLFVVMGTIVIVCAINVRLGIEVVGRTAQVFVSLLVVLLCIIFILLIGDLDVREIFPFLENGLLPSLKGAIAPAAWFSEFIVLAFLLPYINDEKKPLRVILITLLLTTVLMMATNFFCLFLMGDLTDSFTFPFMIAARYISIADFLQHIEAVIIAIWIFGMFIKISVFLYILSTSTAEWFELEDYKPVVAPLAFLCIVYAYWIASESHGIVGLIGPASNVYTLMFLFVLPLTLYGIALLKHAIVRKKNNSELENEQEEQE